MEPFDFQHRVELAGGRCHEDGVGLFELRGQNVSFGDGQAGNSNLFKEDFACDPGEATGVERRGEDCIVEDREQVGGGAFADAAVLVKEDDLVVSALAGLFVPSEVLRPGGDFSPGELIGAVASVGLASEAGPGAPVGEVLRKGDDIEETSLIWGVERPAGVAKNGDPEGGVGRLVGGDQAEQVLVKFVGGDW